MGYWKTDEYIYIFKIILFILKPFSKVLKSIFYNGLIFMFFSGIYNLIYNIITTFSQCISSI